MVFFIFPLLTIAALGAYVGPDQTIAGVPAVLIILFLATFVRALAVRADAAFGRSNAIDDGHRLIEGWPFPLEDPPPRRLVYGYVLSAAGNLIILFGLLGGGLAANGVFWLILLLLDVQIDGAVLPAVPVTIALCISAMIIGSVILIVALGAGSRLRERGRRLRARDARDLLHKLGERPVLLLRSFEDEELVDPSPLNIFQHRYEETLSRALSQLGPVITVGRPGDDLGFSGAARFYVSDDKWQQAIRYLMSNTAAVVIIVGRTSGLWWEIGISLACVPRERLLFFFPLVDNDRQPRSWYQTWKEFVKRWNLPRNRYQQMETERCARYQEFRQRSAEYLAETLPADLNNAFFFDFLPDGRVRVLRSKYGFIRHYMFDLIPRYRRVRFNMHRTVWPFMAKLYESST